MVCDARSTLTQHWLKCPEIGGRKIENADKILSLYDPDVHVIVRGKAGANLECGNSLFLAENAEGFIIDHELKREASPGDSKWLKERYETIREKCAGALAEVVGDQGFESHANVRMLETDDVFNGLFPRNPHELSRRMAEDEVFAAATVRRSQSARSKSLGPCSPTTSGCSPGSPGQIISDNRWPKRPKTKPQFDFETRNHKRGVSKNNAFSVNFPKTTLDNPRLCQNHNILSSPKPQNLIPNSDPSQTPLSRTGSK